MGEQASKRGEREREKAREGGSQSEVVLVTWQRARVGDG